MEQNNTWRLLPAMELRHIIAARLHLLHRRPCPWGCDEVPERSYVGAYGELVAASWLRSQGCHVLRHNFRWGVSGEIDLVCREGETLVFTEVKSSTVDGPYPLLQKVDEEKRALLRRGARNWFMLLGHGVPHRFDVVEVHLYSGQVPELQRHVSAFPPLTHLPV